MYCEKCNNEHDGTYGSGRFCSKHCSMSRNTSGKNNPMYGKTQTEETNKKISITRKELFLKNPELKFKCGNSRLSKIERSEIVKRGHKSRTEYKGHLHTEESKIKIGIKSKEKFTPEYNLRVRKSLEEKELAIPLDKMDDFKLYKNFSNWIDKMFNFIKDEDQLNLLSKNGVWHCKNNKTGVIRDHKYSRYSGWKNLIFPEILRHPENCEIITHTDNIRKKGGWHTDRDSQTLEQLFDKILKFSDEWKEQDKCIKLIEKYKQGYRYNKQEYIKNFYKNGKY